MHFEFRLLWNGGRFLIRILSRLSLVQIFVTTETQTCSTGRLRETHLSAKRPTSIVRDKSVALCGNQSISSLLFNKKWS